MSAKRTYRIKGLSNLLGFSADNKKSAIYNKIDKKEYQIPYSHQNLSSDIDSKKKPREWTVDQIHEIGRDYGFLSELKGDEIGSIHSAPSGVICVMTKKGGAHKTTQAFNIARIAALHGIKTLVIGLDVQCDISRLLGHYAEADKISNLDTLDKLYTEEKGLFEVFTEEKDIFEVIHKSDLPFLDYIPETENLITLSERLENKARREYWLKEVVVDKVKNEYGLIVIDCPPTAGRLVHNVMTVTDLLVSPVACQINNWRNFKRTMSYFKKAAKELRIHDIKCINVITSLKNNSLSKGIKTWYQKNLTLIAPNAIKDSVVFEEANAQCLSLLEYKAGDTNSESYKENLGEIFLQYIYAVENRYFRLGETVPQPTQHYNHTNQTQTTH